MTKTFYLHHTRAECELMFLGLIWSDANVGPFADDGFGNYVSVDLCVTLHSAAQAVEIL